MAFNKLQAIDLILAQEGMTAGETRRAREAYLEFARTREGRQWLRETEKTVLQEIEDQAYMQLVREQGGVATEQALGSQPTRRRRTVAARDAGGVTRFDPEGLGIGQKQIRARANQIIQERLQDIRGKSAAEKAVRRGVSKQGLPIAPETEIVRELENIEMARPGEDPLRRRMEKGEAVGRFAQREANVAAGTRGAIGKELDYGGTEIIRRPAMVRGQRVGELTDILEERDYGRRRIDAYDIDISGETPAVRNKMRFSDAPVDVRKPTPALVAGKAAKGQTRVSRAGQLARSAGGGGRASFANMLSSQDIARLPKAVKALLPEMRTGLEVYKTATGYRVITPQFTSIQPTEAVRQAYAFGFSPNQPLGQRENLSNLFEMSEPEMVKALQETGQLHRIADDTKSVMELRKSGVMNIKGIDTPQFYLHVPKGGTPRIVVMGVETRPVAAPKTPATVTRIKNRRNLTLDDLVQEDPVSTSRTFETMNKKAGITEGRKLYGMSGPATVSPQGRIPASPFTQGLSMSEAASFAREQAKKEVARLRPDLVDPSVRTIRQSQSLVEQEAEALIKKSGGITGYLKRHLEQLRSVVDKTASARRGVELVEGSESLLTASNRISQLEQTIANISLVAEDELKSGLGVTMSPDEIKQAMRDKQYSRLARDIRADLPRQMGRIAPSGPLSQFDLSAKTGSNILEGLADLAKVARKVL